MGVITAIAFVLGLAASAVQLFVFVKSEKRRNVIVLGIISLFSWD